MSVHFNSKQSQKGERSQMEQARREIAWRNRVRAEVGRVIKPLLEGKMLVYNRQGDQGLFEATVRGIVAECRNRGLRIEYQLVNGECNLPRQFMAVQKSQKKVA